ncbi:glucans biosynthesis protein [Sphingomonas laterariae]|uniref:Glucans biosynthesis protein n=1 Tax=Edaphosphingomonas laterariae TaxID=861865 RepID=A0A239JTL3_9SPHN|nr:glucan biosynthesis protein [Sphingomonas laterariae]SNT08788.1 glucans biosynthesis protein [Sphingomonas laterariae]
MPIMNTGAGRAGLTRRHALAGIASAPLILSPAAWAAAPRGGTPFSWDWLRQLAADLAGAAWHAPQPVAAAAAIDYDEVNRIHFRADHALWRGDGERETRFFPIHRFANSPIEIARVENGRAFPIGFDPDMYDVAPDAAGRRFPMAAGFAGFRLMNAGGRGDWLAYQGASYFRSAGALHQYGLSARGLAIDTGIDGREEFPVFTRFWLEPGPADAMTIYALLEGPSVTGAYRFVSRKTDVGPVQDITATLHLRRDVERLGIAPLTSMFWYGEGNRAQGIDWRPEIHDSDGLAILTGTGERIWRPLVNPPHPATSSFADRAPKGFGLLQRDRSFAHYQDDSAYYEKRPNLWVEPQGDWGEGRVMLYEIPTTREIEDNIVAFWTPARPTRKGDRIDIAYRLSWSGTDPAPPALARAVDCWTGVAGRPGHDPIPGARRLVADFVGTALAGLDRDSGVEAVVSATGGKVIATYAYPVVGVDERWRLIVDVAQPDAGASDLRAYLKRGRDALSETLLYLLR